MASTISTRACATASTEFGGPAYPTDSGGRRYTAARAQGTSSGVVAWRPVGAPPTARHGARRSRPWTPIGLKATVGPMPSLKAQVQNGRLVLNEPTTLPDGEIVELVPLDEVLASGGDYLDEEERQRLHQALREGIEEMKAGQTIDADEALAELRAHR